MESRTGALENACKEFEADLVLYYYGDDSEADHRRVELHCAECSRCRRFLDDLRQLLPQMAQPKEMPGAFWDNYYNEVVQKLASEREQPSWWREFLGSMRSWALPAFGTLAVASLAFFFVIHSGTHPKRSATPIPQEILADPHSVEFFKSMDLLESLNKLEQNDNPKMEAPATVSNT
jgi:predicted anti-sigma-YlaC factor YlaD